MTCYVIDDEMHAIKSLMTLIEKTPEITCVGFQQNALQALKTLGQSASFPDITFLDIDMPEISGLDVSLQLTSKTRIVFTTAHPNFAVQAFELGIEDYLLKPISYQRFIKCIHRLRETASGKEKPHNARQDFFYIQTEGKGKVIKLYFSQILYIVSQKNYVQFVTDDNKYLTYLTLTEVEDKLPDTFLRISKSYIVNTTMISQIEGNEVFVSGFNDSFVVGPSYKAAFQAYLNDYYFRSKRSNKPE
jgi:DNA-binding LytR/AlgR family response regulator